MRRAVVLATRALVSSSQPANSFTWTCLALRDAQASSSAAWQALERGPSARSYSWWGGKQAEPVSPAAQPLLTPSLDEAPGAGVDLASQALTPIAAGPSSSLLDPSAIVDAAAVAEAAAIAEAMSEVWAPFRPITWFFSATHDAVGGPWWHAVVLATVAQRILLAPAVVYQTIHGNRLHKAKPDMLAMQAVMAEETARGIQTPPLVQAQRMQAVYRGHKTGPFRILVGIAAQMPVAIGVFSTLRCLAAAQVPSYVQGGALWFPDLSAPDPLYLLPLAVSASFAAALRFGMDGMQQPDGSGQTEAIKTMMRWMPWVMGPATAFLSSGMQLSFLVSNVIGLAQSIVLRSAPARAAMGLDPLPPRGGAAPGAAPVAARDATWMLDPRGSVQQVVVGGPGQSARAARPSGVAFAPPRRKAGRKGGSKA
ncbi:OXA3 [Auxenochlorella protothecoides x Auxenochlorella symbiontica]